MITRSAVLLAAATATLSNTGRQRPGHFADVIADQRGHTQTTPNLNWGLFSWDRGVPETATADPFDPMDFVLPQLARFGNAPDYRELRRSFGRADETVNPVPLPAFSYLPAVYTSSRRPGYVPKDYDQEVAKTRRSNAAMSPMKGAFVEKSIPLEDQVWVAQLKAHLTIVFRYPESLYREYLVKEACLGYEKTYHVHVTDVEYTRKITLHYNRLASDDPTEMKKSRAATASTQPTQYPVTYYYNGRRYLRDEQTN